MKRSSGILILVLMLAAMIPLTGCKKQAGPVVKLIWQSDQDLADHQEYLNRVLKEKDLPYEIGFVKYGEDLKGQTVDIKDRSWTWAEPYDADEEILSGEFLPLDDYLELEEGKVMKSLVPESVWDAFEVNGKQYYLLSVDFVPPKTVYIWDKALAEKYDVHPEDWSEKIWEYEEELKKVSDGEQGRDELIVVQGLRDYFEHLKGMTKTLGVLYPLVIDETDEDGGAALLYETPGYQEYLRGAQRLYEAGIYDPEREESLMDSAHAFLTIDTMFVTKDVYGVWQAEDFWETHEMKELWTEPLWQLSVDGPQTGISAESAHPDEAFSFLCSLYTDPELTNALVWGEEGVDYKLHGNIAEDPVRGGYITPCYGGNMLIAHAEFGAQDEDKEELYPKWLEECEDSRIKGFNFSAEGCEAELQKALEISNQWRAESGSVLLEENETRIRQYKEAGIDKVIGEWDRQYREYLKKREE